jgi:DNA-binding LytR/AlgR family response regulator
MNCIAIDDEALALELIEDNIRKVPFLHLVKTCRSAFEAIELMKEETIDLIFLDIQMPEINGIKFLKSISQKPMVIFTTAYDKYAIEGYELDVIDYLLKPIPFDRFLKAVNKAYDLYYLKSYSSHSTTDRQFPGKLPDFIFVKADYSMVKINFDDILYIEGLKDYIKIYAGGRPIITLTSLKSIEEKLPSDQFIRVHRSFIISLSKIKSVQKSVVKIGEKEIPIGDSFRDPFLQVIERFR